MSEEVVNLKKEIKELKRQIDVLVEVTGIDIGADAITRTNVDLYKINTDLRVLKKKMDKTPTYEY